MSRRRWPRGAANFSVPVPAEGSAAAAAISLAERTTVITFRQAVQLPGLQLAAGTYIFERAKPLGPALVVRVFSRDRRIAHFTGFTTFADRPRGMPLTWLSVSGRPGPMSRRRLLRGGRLANEPVTSSSTPIASRSVISGRR
ncbi:MAG TPA: hypothetical protein VNJ02_10170 [Vicinamibacterales bacterium]|nr:hypothetical protein [Vicinamibacterales bacterium]